MVELNAEDDDLAQHDFVALRRDLGKHLRLPRILGEAHVRELVVEAEVAPILCERRDHRIDHLEPRGAKCCQQCADIGNDPRGRHVIKLWPGSPIVSAENAVLYVDHEQRRAPAHDRPVTGEAGR